MKISGFLASLIEATQAVQFPKLSTGLSCHFAQAKVWPSWTIFPKEKAVANVQAKTDLDQKQGQL